MRDKLVELIQKSDILCDSCGENSSSYCAEFLADYLLINGVIAPPCKLGSTVYMVISDKRVKKPYECEVVGFWYSKEESCSNIHLVRYVNGVFDCSFSVPFDQFGKTVFLRKNEAENALKEREGK